jgi:predicted amino acid dehydrogenase
MHPGDATRKYKLAKYLPDWAIEKMLATKKPFIASFIDGVESITGQKTEGWFVICPLTPKQMKANPEFAYKRIVQAAELVKSEGADIMGLGAFTAVVGDSGVTIAERSPIPITTGNSYTVASAIEGTLRAASLIGVIPADSTLGVVGATGSIGKTCAQVLAPQFKNTLVIGRDPERTRWAAEQVPGSTPTTEVADLIAADVVISVSSAGENIVFPEHLKQGAIICDVSRPRDVSARVANERPDVLVIEGGVVEVPGNVDFRYDFGFPPKTAFACMCETMMLCLEDRMENFTLGKEVSVDQVNQTFAMAEKHGFRLAGFRAFEKALDSDAIQRVIAARKAAMVAVAT